MSPEHDGWEAESMIVRASAGDFSLQEMVLKHLAEITKSTDIEYDKLEGSIKSGLEFIFVLSEKVEVVSKVITQGDGAKGWEQFRKEASQPDSNHHFVKGRSGR